MLPKDITPNTEVITRVSRECYWGTFRCSKTYQRLAAELYWVGMKNDVKEMVARCDVCQHHKYMAMMPRGLL